MSDTPYPQRGMALCIAEDRQHVLLVPMQVDGPGQQAQPVGRPTDVTQGFWASLLNICPAGETTKVYGGGKHVMNVTVEMIDAAHQTPVPEQDLEQVPDLKFERKKIDLDQL